MSLKSNRFTRWYNDISHEINCPANGVRDELRVYIWGVLHFVFFVGFAVGAIMFFGYIFTHYTNLWKGFIFLCLAAVGYGVTSILRYTLTRQEDHSARNASKNS